jgi:hypothetical protein
VGPRPRLVALEHRTLLATLVVNPAGGPGVFTAIQAAVNAANLAGGDTIQITPATYTEQITIAKSLTMMGTGPGAIIQAPSTLTTDPVSGLNALLEIENSATVNMSDLTIQGPVPQNVTINAGILVVGGATATVTDSTISHIRSNPITGVGNTGQAIQIGGARGSGLVGNGTITNDIITDYQKSGILVRGGSSATITGNTITGVGPTAAVAQNGIQVDLGATATITGNTITGNEFANSTPDPTNTDQATGILIDNFPPVIPGGTITVSNNTIGGTAAGAGNDLGISSSDPEITVAISGNTLQGNRFEGVLVSDGTATVSNNNISGSNIGVAVLAFSGDTANANATLTSNNITDNGNGGLSVPGGGIRLLVEPGATTTALATANFNRIVGNSVGLDNTTAAAVDATLNWWGSNTGPNTTGNDTTSGAVNTSPWLVLSVSKSLATIGPGGTSTVTASVTNDSSGSNHSIAPFFPNGVPIAFGATGGTMSPATAPTRSGSASSSFTSTAPGDASASVTLDNQTLSTPITIQAINVTPPPTPQQTTAGQPFSQSFTVTGGAGGFVYTVSAGQLPPGLALNASTGLVSGSTTTPGTYAFTVLATDVSAARVSESLTITVAPAQAAAPVVKSLQRFGFHAQPTTFVLTFSTALEQAPAEDVANYQLNPILGHGLGQAISITAAVYDPMTHTVTLHTARRVYLFRQYRLLVNGSTPTGVTGATGLLLDGKGNGQPGSDLMMTFGKEILAGPNVQVSGAERSGVSAMHPTARR